MIKRWYFFSARGPYRPENDDVGTVDGVFYIRSWFPDLKKAHNIAVDGTRKSLNADMITITAFNRV